MSPGSPCVGLSSTPWLPLPTGDDGDDEPEAVEEELRGPLNVCSGRGTTLRQLLAMGSELTGHSLEVRVNPAFVRENEVHKLVGGRSALERAIGPVAPIPLRETLSWMLGAR